MKSRLWSSTLIHLLDFLGDYILRHFLVKDVMLMLLIVCQLELIEVIVNLVNPELGVRATSCQFVLNLATDIMQLLVVLLLSDLHGLESFGRVLCKLLTFFLELLLVDHVSFPELRLFLVCSIALGNGTFEIYWLVLFSLHADHRNGQLLLLVELLHLLTQPVLIKRLGASTLDEEGLLCLHLTVIICLA